MRLTSLSEGDIAEVIARLRQDLDELKARQLVAWDNLVTYKHYSGAPFDIAATLGPGQSRQYEVTFTHANARGGAIMELNAFYRINDSNVMGFPVPRRTPTNPNIAVRWRKSESADTHTKWRLFIINTSIGSSYTGYVKLYFDGTDTGTFAVQPL